MRVASAADLVRALSCSPASLSRLVAAAGELVCRRGRGRATRYARTRRIEALGRKLPAVRVDEKGRTVPAGTLHLLWEGQHWWEQEERSQLFTGLPPELADMAPQGYLGQ